MRIILILILAFAFNYLQAQTIGSFVSVAPANQSQLLVIPNSHNFQRIIKTGDAITGGNGTLPASIDFTGFVPIAASSTNGYLSLNHENNVGAVTVLDVNFNLATNLWATTAKNNVNLTPVYNTSTNCSGGITPWGTVLSGEETIATVDGNMDGYFDNGWLMEINPSTRTATRKLWAAGRCKHENASIKLDGSLLYTGADDPTEGFLYKYVFSIANDPTNGLLYALKKTGTTGTWLLINNTTQANRNNTGGLAASAGATNFNGIEDVEIGPNSQIYFASKGSGEVFRFTDNGTGITDFMTFVGGGSTNYNINFGSGIVSQNWGLGNDNLAFDGEGNLWVLQDLDGSRNLIWVVKPGHTQAAPQVEVFGNTPIGSEPTGITFTPDFKFMFISFQHPSSSNSATQLDAAGNSITWNTHTTVVISNAANLVLSTLNLNTINLNGQLINNSHNLKWNIANTSNVQLLTLEHSMNQLNFEALINFDVINQNNNSFSFKPNGTGNHFYRLKYKDNNGNINYSNLLKLDYKTTTIFSLECIEANKYNLKYNNLIQGNMIIKIVDNQGKQVFTKKINTAAPQTNYYINLNNFAKGIYYLNITNKQVFETLKVLVK